ncbi:MAG: L-serine ammonia-lyase [Crocinitomicaceae bacterium]|nr:L-serine ammonia-lyase [Crocinitomicaceae bacterium]
MEYISVFDMLKVGIGPSSSHTLGPWRAAERWIESLKNSKHFDSVQSVAVDLYGSLSLTGKGHATDLATMLGLSGMDPETIPVEDIGKIIERINKDNLLTFGGEIDIVFNPINGIRFSQDFLPFHPNGMRFTARLMDQSEIQATYYSIGGGFVVKEENDAKAVEIKNRNEYPFPVNFGSELMQYCSDYGKTISEIVWENELVLRSAEEIESGLKTVWNTMLESMYIGCHTEGTLPGGLEVRRRSFDLHEKLKGQEKYNSPQEWLLAIRKTEVKFREILKWVSCFAMSVNEVNASLGRVVTAPTNGSAGVIPSVLMYYMVIENHSATFEHVKKFLLVAAEIGSIVKKGATISAAMGGCQAEIGVSSAMAAGALTELLGGTHEQVLIAAEIAMEHHLGLTCDPIGGLVQIPCIERNSMGALKAINAAEMALDRDPDNVRVPFDSAVKAMKDTADDMNSKYKETSQGGLAIGVNIADC